MMIVETDNEQDMRTHADGLTDEEWLYTHAERKASVQTRPNDESKLIPVSQTGQNESSSCIVRALSPAGSYTLIIEYAYNLVRARTRVILRERALSRILLASRVVLLIL